MSSTERYHVVNYPDTVDKAIISCFSECGPIRLVFLLGSDHEPTRVACCDADAAHSCAVSEILLLNAEPSTPGLASVSFVNNSKSQGKVGLSVALNFLAASNQERVRFEDTLQPLGSAAVHITFNKV